MPSLEEQEQYARLLRGDLSAATPESAALARLLGAEVTSAAADPETKAHQAMESWLAFEAPESSNDEGLWGRITRQWCALFEGRGDEDEKLVADASGAGEAFAAVAAQSQRALHALQAGDSARATLLARRASRMARVEGLLVAEYLANLVLARARRHAGQGFLCLRIAAALDKVVPAPWRAWLHWEQLFAGGQPDSPEGAAAFVIDAYQSAAKGGDYGAARARLLMPGDLPAPMRADFEALDALLTPFHEPRFDAFTLGAVHEYPISLSGWPALFGEQAEPVGEVCVVVGDGPGRRVLPAGLGLLSASLGENIFFIADGERKSRVHAFICALAMCPEQKASEADIFTSVWGFNYVADKHQTLVKTAVSRARTDIERFGEIARSGGMLTLVVHKPFALPDPRCRPSLNQRVLRALASSEGRFSAKEAAQQLGVSLRHVQTALSSLVEDGACERVKVGRNVAYELEDTTFDQPTLARLRVKS